MEQYFQPDIISNILLYLNKDSSFYFLNIATFLQPIKRILYEKYMYSDHLIENNDIKKYIANIKISEIKYASEYENLKSLAFYNLFFNTIFPKLPSKIESLLFYSQIFNQPIDNLPNTLTSLTIISSQFDQPINNLPLSLKSLTIKSDSFSQSFDQLPKTLQSLNVNCWIFKHQFDNLPETLQSLTIKCNTFDFPLDKLPKGLKVLDIYSINGMSYPLDKLPNTLETLSLTGDVFIKVNPDLNILPKSLKILQVRHEITKFDV